MSLDIRQKIQEFVKERPEYLLYEESQILSIMVSEGRISKQDVEKAKATSAFGFGFDSSINDYGWSIEKNSEVQVPLRAEETPKPQKQQISPKEKQLARSYIAQMLFQQALQLYDLYYQTATNRSFGNEGMMELQEIGKTIVDGLDLEKMGIPAPDTRDEIYKIINNFINDCIKMTNCSEKEFEKLFKFYCGKDMDYQNTIEYIESSTQFANASSSEKLNPESKVVKDLIQNNKEFQKLIEISISKRVEDWSGNTLNYGGLVSLGFDMALLYGTGGFSAISKASAFAGEAMQSAMKSALKNIGMKKSITPIIEQMSGITASQLSGAALSSTAFQVTKVIDAVADGKVTKEEGAMLSESTIGLFKFGYVGSAISGPLGVQVAQLTSRMLNSTPVINQVLKSVVTSKPTPLTNVLKGLSEHSNAVSAITNFGTSFSINAGYMAMADGMSYGEALESLAEMDAVSKMVAAFMGGKNTAFLTPQKIQQVKTELAGMNVNLTVFKGKKVFTITDKEGKITRLANEQELIMFVADKIASEGVNKGVGVNNNAEIKVPKGKINEVDEAFHRAKTENPAEVVAEKVKAEFSEKKVRIEGTPLEIRDYDEINSLIEKFSDEFSKDNLISKIKYKEQIPVLKELLNFVIPDDLGKNTSLPDSHYGFFMDKVNNLEELKELMNVINKNTKYWNAFLHFYKTPYLNLVSKVLSKYDTNISSIIKLELNDFLFDFDTPEKITKAENFLDNLDNSQRFSNLTRLKAAINGDNNITDLVRPVRALIDNKFGEGRSLFFSEEELYEISQNISSISQKKTLMYLIKINTNTSNIPKILQKISSEKDFQFVENLVYKVMRDNNGKTQQELSKEINKHLSCDIINLKPEQKPYIRSLYKLFCDNVISSRKFDKLQNIKYSIHNKEIAEYIEQKFMSMNKEEAFHAINNDLIYKILEYSENDFAIQAMKIADEYNKTKDHFYSPIDLFSYGEEGILASIKNQNDLDFYKQLIEKGVDIGDSLNFLMKAGVDTNKRQTILTLIEYTNKYGRDEYGSKNFDTETLENIIKLLDSEENVANLNKLLKGNIFGKKYSLKEINNLLIKKSNKKNYVNILQKQYSSLKNYKDILSQIQNDTEFDLFTKIYKDGETNPISLVQLLKTARENKCGYKNLTHIASNAEIMDIFEIHKDTYLSELIMLISKPDGIKKINDLIKSDLYKGLIRDSSVRGGHVFYNESYIQDKIKMKNGTYVQRFNNTVPKSEIFKKVSNGDVLTIDGKLYIRDGKELVKLNISEKTYLKLFPAGERFNTKQGEVGDCWLVATIDILLKNPKGRVELLKFFKEDGNDLYVTIPNQDPIPFPNAEPLNKNNDIFANHAKACDGFRILEEAVAFARAKQKNINIDNITDMNKMMNVLTGGTEPEAFNLLFGDLGKNIPPISNKKQYKYFLEQYSDSDTAVIRTGIDWGTNIPIDIIQKYGLSDRHAYNIEGYDKENNIVYVINPHNTLYRIEIPLEVFEKYFSNILIYDFNKI